MAANRFVTTARLDLLQASPELADQREVVLAVSAELRARGVDARGERGHHRDCTLGFTL